MQLTREQVLRFRWRATELDAEPSSTRIDELAALDLGVQDGANAAGAIGLMNRGVAPDAVLEATSGFTDRLALAWTVRGAPHFVRRVDLPDVQESVSPFDDADAAKRSVTAGKALDSAGIGAIEGMRVLASAMRAAVPRATSRVSKGELSSAVTSEVPKALLVECRPCGATHPHEQLFRLCALHAGLELEPGTNPPTLRRIPNWPRRAAGPAADPERADERVHPVRAYLRLLGPARPRDVAGYLETTVGVVKQHWPDDAVEVDLDGEPAWMLPGTDDALAAAADAPRASDRAVRLLSGFDLFMAAKDRDRLIPERSRQKAVWPVLGRPGVVVEDGEPIGAWRPASTKKRLTVKIELWAGGPSKRLATAIDEQAERVAEARDQHLDGVVFD